MILVVVLIYVLVFHRRRRRPLPWWRMVVYGMSIWIFIIGLCTRFLNCIWILWTFPFSLMFSLGRFLYGPMHLSSLHYELASTPPCLCSKCQWALHHGPCAHCWLGTLFSNWTPWFFLLFFYYFCYFLFWYNFHLFSFYFCKYCFIKEEC